MFSNLSYLEVVTPVDPGSSPGGVQMVCNCLKRLDSGFRRNDGKWGFSTFYETINITYDLDSVMVFPFRPAFDDFLGMKTVYRRCCQNSTYILMYVPCFAKR